MPFATADHLFTHNKIYYTIMHPQMQVFFHFPFAAVQQTAKREGKPLQAVRGRYAGKPCDQTETVFSSCSSSFSSSSENPSGHKNTSGVSFRQSCGYIRSLLSYPPQAFPEAAESADHGHQTDFSVSGSSFVRDQGLHHSVSCLPKDHAPRQTIPLFHCMRRKSGMHFPEGPAAARLSAPERPHGAMLRSFVVTGKKHLRNFFSCHVSGLV